MNLIHISYPLERCCLSAQIAYKLQQSNKFNQQDDFIGRTENSQQDGIKFWEYDSSLYRLSVTQSMVTLNNNSVRMKVLPNSWVYTFTSVHPQQVSRWHQVVWRGHHAGGKGCHQAESWQAG